LDNLSGLEIIFDIQDPEKALSDLPRNFCLFSGFLIKGYGLM